MAIRAEVEPTDAVLRSVWTVNARLCRLEGRIGVIQPGPVGHVIISAVKALEDLRAFTDHERAFSHVIQAGVPVVDRSDRPALS